MSIKEPKPYRGLTADLSGYYIEPPGGKKYQWKFLDLSAADTERIIAPKVDKLEEIEIKLSKREISVKERREYETEVSRFIFKTALEDFADKDWEELYTDKKVGRGTLIKTAMEIYGFLVEISTKDELKLLRLRSNMITPIT